MLEYRIARFKPSYYDGIMETLGVEGEDAKNELEITAPRYRAVVRKGKQRIRTMVELQVLPGTMFIPVENVALVNKLIELTPFTLRYVRNPTDEWALAVCSHVELQPIITWAESRNNEAEKKAIIRQIIKPERRKPLPSGTRVTLRGGPFSGHTATVVSDTGLISSVEVDGMRFPVNIASCQIHAA